jgi:hypothetical protein
MFETPVLRDLVLTREERYKDMLHEAATERFASQRWVKGESSNRLYSQVLIWLGRQLVAWGWRLQGRYGTMAKTPVSLTANHTG